MQQRYPSRHPQQQWGPQHHGGQMHQMPPYHGGPIQQTPPSYMPHPAQAQYMQTDYMTRQISIEEAIQIGREQMPGQVVKVELERKGGRLIYEVDIISTQGPKYEVKIDATTGEVIEVELD